jgi:DNA repair protein RadC
MAHHSTPIQPRERLLQYGPQKLSTLELLALILGTGSVTQSVLDLARTVLPTLLHQGCTAHELCIIPGIGPAKASALMAAVHLQESLAALGVSAYQPSSAVVALHCQDLLSVPQEQVAVFTYDARGLLQRRHLISLGSVSASLVHPREVFRAAVLDSASAVVIAHTHPSGDPTPSEADYSITAQLIAAGSLIGIPVLDHVVVAHQGSCSIRHLRSDLFSSIHNSHLVG